jgi:ribosomal protein L37AE/L43A
VGAKALDDMLTVRVGNPLRGCVGRWPVDMALSNAIDRGDEVLASPTHGVSFRPHRSVASVPTAPPVYATRLEDERRQGSAICLLDDVGWRLWDRSSDVVRVTTGRVRCPVCATELQVRAVGRAADEVVPCPGCGWSVTGAAWHGSWRHRDLNGVCPEFGRFVDAWPSARSIRDRMLLIDSVVHALHVASRSDMPGNFAARNFIEGSRPKIVALLDELAEGPGSHVAEGVRQRWNAARDHYRSGRRQSR